MTSAHTDAAVVPALPTRTRRHGGAEGGGSAPATGCAHEGAGGGTQQSSPPWTLHSPSLLRGPLEPLRSGESSSRSCLHLGAVWHLGRPRWKHPERRPRPESSCSPPHVQEPQRSPTPSPAAPSLGVSDHWSSQGWREAFLHPNPQLCRLSWQLQEPSTSECFLDPASSSGNLRAKQNRCLVDAWRRARRQLWGSCLGHSRLTGTWTDCDSGCQGRGSVLLHTPWQPWGP